MADKKLHTATKVAANRTSGTCGSTENPSKTDEPSRSADPAGLSKVVGTPSIWAITQIHRQSTPSRMPHERLEFGEVIITWNHTDSDAA